MCRSCEARNCVKEAHRNILSPASNLETGVTLLKAPCDAWVCHPLLQFSEERMQGQADVEGTRTSRRCLTTKIVKMRYSVEGAHTNALQIRDWDMYAIRSFGCTKDVDVYEKKSKMQNMLTKKKLLMHEGPYMKSPVTPTLCCKTTWFLWLLHLGSKIAPTSSCSSAEMHSIWLMRCFGFRCDAPGSWLFVQSTCKWTW